MVRDDISQHINLFRLLCVLSLLFVRGIQKRGAKYFYVLNPWASGSRITLCA